MGPFYRSSLLVACFLLSVAVAMPQQTQSTSFLTAVPRLVRFTGSFQRPTSQPGVIIGATFAVYSQQEGGTPLWTESQNVELDATGNYTVLLGATKNAGMPPDLFATGESRWLQVQFYAPGEISMPRVLLVSVPYALKAGDAETLGGKPASAYLLAGSSASPPLEASAQTAVAQPVPLGSVPPPATTVNYLARFTTSAGALGNSVIYESGSSIGVGTRTPAATLEVNGKAQVDGGSILASGSEPVIQFPAGSTNFGAGLEALSLTTTGTGDTAIGDSALQANTTGNNNTAVGYDALYSNTTGSFNTAGGITALFANTTGNNNTAIGNGALNANTSGGSNTATGVAALLQNITGNGNVADGNSALYSNTTGAGNVAIGTSAMLDSVGGSWNVAEGNASMYNTTAGSYNTAIGNGALFNNSTGSNNIAVGSFGGNNVTGSNNIDIGDGGTSSDSGTIRIGTIGTQTSSYIAGIAGVTLPTPDEPLVCIDPPLGSWGHLTAPRAARPYSER